MDLTTGQGRKRLGRRIRTAISEAGYASLPAFAETLGCSRALIYQYVNADVLVQLDRLAQIAELTGRDLTWFFTPEPDGKTQQQRKLEKQLEACEGKREELESELGEERRVRLREEQQHRQELLEAVRELTLAHRRLGDPEDTLSSAVLWRSVARRVADEDAQIAAAVNIGHSAYEMGDYARAREALTEAISGARRLGKPRAELSARQELVRVAHAAGDFAGAIEQARELAEAEWWWPQWAGRLAMAALHEQSGDLEAAERKLAEAREIIDSDREQPDQVNTARVYWQANRANIALARGQYISARQQAEHLRDIAGDAGLHDQRLEGALNLAIAELRLGNTERAGRLLQYLQESSDSRGDRTGPLAEVFRAELLLRQERHADARDAARQALEGAQAARSGLVLAEAELMLGRTYLAEGMVSDAGYYIEKCLGRAERLRLSRLELSARLALLRGEILDGLEDFKDDGFVLLGLAGSDASAGALERIEKIAKEAAERGHEDIKTEAALTLAAISADDGAVTLAEQIVTDGRESGYAWAERSALLLLARLYDDRGDEARAQDALERLAELPSETLSSMPQIGEAERDLPQGIGDAKRD